MEKAYWLVSQKLEYAEHRIAFEEMLLAMRQDRHKSTLLTDLCHRALLLL